MVDEKTNERIGRLVHQVYKDSFNHFRLKDGREVVQRDGEWVYLIR